MHKVRALRRLGEGMAEPEIDLERAVSDPDYRRRVIAQLNSESASEKPNGTKLADKQDKARKSGE